MRCRTRGRFLRIARWQLAALVLICAVAAPISADTCSWDNANSVWSDASHWNGCATPPGVGDTAVIGGGLVNVDAAVTVDNLTLTGGRLWGPEDLQVTVAVNWTGGSMEAAGKIVIPQSATLAISGTSTKTLTRNMDLGGAATWSGTGGLSFGASTLAILTTGSFTIQNDLSFGGAGATLSNSGTVTKSAGGGETECAAAFNQTADGSLVVQSGTFRFRGGSVDGTVTATGNTIAVGGFTTTFESTATFTATNLNVISGGAIFNLGGGSFTVTNGTVSGGTLRFDGPAVSLPNLTVSAGTFTGSADVEVTTDLTWSGGQMTGSGKTTVTDSADLSISGDTAKTLSRDLDNGGTATWTGLGDILGSSTFTNLSTGSLTIENDESWSNSIFVNEGAIIKSVGTDETQITPFVTQTSTGSFDIQTGLLRFAQGGSFDGTLAATGTTIQVAAASATFMATASLTATNYLNSGSAVTTFALGGASYTVTNTTITGGTIFFNGPTVTLPNLTIGGGGLNGSSEVVVTGLLSWTSGSMFGTGKTSVPDGATLAITGNSDKNFGGGRVLENAGSASWSGTGAIQSNNGTFTNLSTGSLKIENDQKYGISSAKFNNSGSVVKTGGSGETEFFADFQQSSSGSVEIQDGDFRLSNGGSIDGTIDAADRRLRFTGGVFTFDPAVSFTVGDVDVTAGQVDMSPIPNLTIDNLTHTGGTLTMDNPSVLILGDFVRTGGTFVPGCGRIILGGDKTQNLSLSVPTDFFFLEVIPGTLVVETEEADNASVIGFLRQWGTIRKTKAIPVSGDVTFGLTGIELDIIDPGTFTFLEVNRIGLVHPNTAPPAIPRPYWRMTPVGGDFIVDLTLNHCLQPDAEMLLCRYTGTSWDCANEASTQTTITRFGVTQLGDWAKGAVAPNIFMTSFECGLVQAWTDVRGLCPL